MTSSQRQPRPVPATGGVRLVTTTDLRKLHRLLTAVLGMELVDLSLNLYRMLFGS